ncbi:MAG: transglycosylase SLT domain-containing protein [Desulfobacteraceae bacterium]|jgi:membrane-bound lytic murein transglycosylase D|nr:transglycosylase SLT domain-containing protein [Desulfobacteraceae bacterium]
MTVVYRLVSGLKPVLIAGAMAGCLASSLCSADTFSNPPATQSTVAFWLSIYTRYPLTQGVIHDSRYPEIVYEVIELEHPDAAGAYRINDHRMRRARAAYRQIIDRIIQTPGCDDPEVKRVAGMFGPLATPDQLKKAKRRIRCQVGQRDRFRDGLIRSAAHIDRIRAIFRNAGLPEDLAYQPHVESSFNHHAHSKSGAVGIWQFTRQTGRHYLQIDAALDERLDPIRASEAAALLLQTNYRRLGSWPLAITAYNHGISGMLRAKRRHQTYAAIFQDYRNRRFRFASRNFYPEFLAAREAAKHSHRYFDDLPPSVGRPTFQVAPDGFAPFAAVSAHFKLDSRLLHHLNPALRPSVIRGLQDIPAGYPIRLPSHEWQYRLAYNARIPHTLLSACQKPCPVYRVRKGDTISSIARRHNLSIGDVVAANNLSKRGNRIFVNQKLHLPIAKGRL